MAIKYKRDLNTRPGSTWIRAKPRATTHTSSRLIRSSGLSGALATRESTCSHRRREAVTYKKYFIRVFTIAHVSSHVSLQEIFHFHKHISWLTKAEQHTSNPIQTQIPIIFIESSSQKKNNSSHFTPPHASIFM